MHGGWVSKLETYVNRVVFIWPENKDWIPRLWLMHGLQVHFTKASVVDFACKTGALACTLAFPDGGWEFGHFDPDIARALSALDCMTCTVGDPEDESWIKDFLRKGRDGPDGFNKRIARISAGPVLRDAARHGDVAEIQRVCSRSPGLVMTRGSLRGSLGETAAHIASA